MEPPINIFEFLSEKSRDNVDIAELATKSDNLASINFQYCSDRLKGEIDFVKSVITKYPDNFQYASESLRNDIDVIHYAFLTSLSTLKYVGDDFKKTDMYIEYMKLAIKNTEFENPGVSLVASFKGNEFCDRKTMVLFTVKYDNKLIYYAKELLLDEKFMLDAALVNPTVFYWYPHKLKNDRTFIKNLIEGISKSTQKIFLSDILKSIPRDLTGNKSFMLELQKVNAYLSTYKPFMDLLGTAQ
jgi:hypothetical protein